MAGDALQAHLVLRCDEPDPPLAGWLDIQLIKAARLSDVARCDLTIAVVEDAEMAQLHEQYTGVAGTTDVLTFDLGGSAEHDPSSSAPDHDDPVAVEGDIVVCLDEANRRSAELGHPVRHELLLYAVHGLMHLLGEDDHDEAAYQRMHAREDALLTQMGFGPLFHPDSEP